jgi:hypothetical protein
MTCLLLGFLSWFGAFFRSSPCGSRWAFSSAKPQTEVDALGSPLLAGNLSPRTPQRSIGHARHINGAALSFLRFRGCTSETRLSVKRCLTVWAAFVDARIPHRAASSPVAVIALDASP